MAWFGQGKDTIEWVEYNPNILFYKWKEDEIKKGSRLIIRVGQKAVFYAGGRVEGVFEEEGTYDIETQIVPFLSTLKGVFSLRGDSGLRAEIYFVNSKELLLNWGTRQRIMLPSPEVPSGIPVGCHGNLVVVFRDYLTFIHKVAGMKSTYTLQDISERIMGELNGIIAEAILDGQNSVGLNSLISLQMNNRRIAKRMCEELDKELFDIGLGVSDLNIISINYPDELQEMAEKMAAQSFIRDTGKYAAVHMADGMAKGNGAGIAAMGAQAAVGVQLGQQLTQAMRQPPSACQGSGQQFVCTSCGKVFSTPCKFCSECGQKVEAVRQGGGDRFCPTCRKMVNGKFCPDCGTKTV